MAYSNFYARFYILRQKTGAALLSVWNFLPTRWYLGFSALLQAVAWWQAFFIYRNLAGGLLVLHYNVDFGIDLVGDPIRIFVYPLIGLGILVFNFIVAATFNHYQEAKVFNHLCLAGAALFNAFLLLAVLSIYLINFR